MLSIFVSNAIKFTSHGGILIEAEEIECDGENALLEFSVRDTGVGIAHDKLHLLFESFSQVDSSSTRSHGGSGLGLSIVRKLAELMNGEVGVESKVGLGSRFWFCVRLERA
jgi:signal transduction histidine kinase